MKTALTSGWGPRAFPLTLVCAGGREGTRHCLRMGWSAPSYPNGVPFLLYAFECLV